MLGSTYTYTYTLVVRVRVRVGGPCQSESHNRTAPSEQYFFLSQPLSQHNKLKFFKWSDDHGSHLSRVGGRWLGAGGAGQPNDTHSNKKETMPYLP